MLQGTRTWNRQLMAGVLAVWMLLCAIPQPILAAAGDALAEGTALSLQAMSSGNGYSAEDTYAEKLANLRYDDHIDMTGKTVEVIDAGTPTSYQVGYGVAENAVRDTAVVTLSGSKLIATGIGIATVKLDGVLHKVTVTAAPISLLLLAGQSNMQGSEGDENQSIVCPDGMVYSTYGDRYTMTTANATNFAPSALTGSGSGINVNGTTTNLEEWPIYLLNERGIGKKGPDSGFAYEWVKQTGEKVWIVNAAHGGSSINTWQKTGENYKEALALFTACQETLRKEIAAGHYTLSHMGYFWCQGCTDYGQTAEWYVNKYLSMHENFKTQMAFDHDSNPDTSVYQFEFGGIIPVRAGNESYTSYRQGVYADITTKRYYESFKDLRFTGPRVAQYWMTNNPDLPDIWNVCNIGEDWVWMPDGTNGVTEYFQSHYPNGTVDYTTQVPQAASWYTPTTPADVHDSIHYNQIGYNEVGREAARNALIMLGEMEEPDVETSVEFLTWDGYTAVTEIVASTLGGSGTLVVPMVYPVWKSKQITYQLSEGLRWEYYDLIAETPMTEGVLADVVTGTSVAVKARELSNYTWELDKGTLVSSGENENVLTRISGTTENGLFVDTQYRMQTAIHLIHDQNWVLEWKMTGPWYDENSTTSRKLFCQNGASASANAWCLLVNGKNDRISIGYYGTNTHISYGISLREYGISVVDSHVYRLVNHINTDGSNTIYLVVDGKQIGAMTRYFTGSGGDMGTESNYLSGKDISFGYLGVPSYLLNDGIVEYISVVETNAHQDIHFHDWSAWETVIAAGKNGPGEEKRVCACGETERRTVNSIWQTTNLGTYYQQIPENTCAELNLWSVLRHDPTYYVVSKGDWDYHSSKNVPSVTIPLNAGDKIFATSFGKAGENGHASSNGIRVTFFDINGVVKTMAPAETYAEFAANGGYLIAPEDAVAINIPMWNNSDDNEIYILSLDHTYKNGICTGCGSTVLNGNYTHAIPENQGVQNAIDRAYALTDVEWTPLADVPGVQKINGEFAVVPFKGGITYRGIPYSGVTANDCYVGLNVSLESFLTALKNKNSVLYTENLFNTNPKSATYFGTVCSKFAQYVLDIPGSYNTNNMANIPGMETIALPGKYTVDQIKLGDVVLHTQDHTTVCTDILYDADGNVAYIEISEAVMPLVRRNYWSPEEFYAHFSGYRLCRYQYISEVPAFQKTEPASDYALMPRFGDKYNYKVSAAKGVVDVLKSGYYKAIILRDGTVIDEIILNGATTFLFDRSIPGSLEMYLEKEDGTHSASVFACVVKSSVTVDDASKFANGKLTVTIDGSCGTPVYVQVGSAHAIFCNVEGTDGTVNISFPFSKVSSRQVRVAYQNEYGIYLSSWVSFTADENPSVDPLLSQAQYWNGYNITPNNPTPVIQENKVGYWSYTMIPVIGGETYYSAGATRMWFLDENGNPISTYNAYLDGEVPFRFTVPENAVYVNIAYSPLIEQGSETIEIVHNYKSVVTPPTCTEQGYTTHTCACGDSYVDSYVPATGHKFSVYIADGNATYEADGTKTALCDHGCGTKDTVADVGSMLFPEQVTSSVYTISGGVLSKVPAGTTVSQLLSGLDWGKYCTVFDTNGKAVDSSAKVATGMVVKLLRGAEVKQTLTIAVRGDTSGDGAVTLTDFVQIKAHLLQKQTLTGAAATAADYSADGSVTVTDFMQVKALLLRTSA